VGWKIELVEEGVWDIGNVEVDKIMIFAVCEEQAGL
jgi:hypothetical protein